jgi:hypothetical protein
MPQNGNVNGTVEGEYVFDVAIKKNYLEGGIRL